MSADKTEWEGIFEPGHERPVMSVPPRMTAADNLVREVAAALGLDYWDAIGPADWIADKMERFGASMAEPVFDMDGSGPLCSWCKTIWPLCGHHHLSIVLDEDDAEAAS